MSTEETGNGSSGNKRSWNMLALGIPFGLIGGALVGTLTDNLALCTGIGMLIGIIGGALLDQRRSSRE